MLRIRYAANDKICVISDSVFQTVVFYVFNVSTFILPAERNGIAECNSAIFPHYFLSANQEIVFK